MPPTGPLVGWHHRDSGAFIGKEKRVPGRRDQGAFILRWPAALQAGTTYKNPVSTLDLYETFQKPGRKRTSGPGRWCRPDADTSPAKEAPLIPFLAGRTTAPVMRRRGLGFIRLFRNQALTLQSGRDIAKAGHQQGPEKASEMLLRVEGWKKDIRHRQPGAYIT